MEGRNMKAPVQIEPVDLFVSLIDGLALSVGEVIDCGKQIFLL